MTRWRVFSARHSPSCSLQRTSLKHSPHINRLSNQPSDCRCGGTSLLTSAPGPSATSSFAASWKKAYLP